MADTNKILGTIVQIDNENYEITAARADTATVAEKVANKLTINTGDSVVEFDGSEAKTVTVVGGTGGTAGTADKVQVTMDNNAKVYATITVKSSDPTPTEGAVGDIWFRY